MARSPGRGRTKSRSEPRAGRITRRAALSLAAALCASLTAAGALATSGPASRSELIARPWAENGEIRQLGMRSRVVPGGDREKVGFIVDQIFDKKNGLGFRYQARPTLTATEAVERRSGNCLSLVSLFVSIARQAGVDAFYVQVEDFEIFYRYRGTIVRSRHVVGGVQVAGRLLTVDFLPYRPKRYRQLRRIGDRRAAALYYNAVANEAMLNDDHELAGRRFREALEVEPDFAETWNNYAILQRRSGDLEEAIRSLERARRLDPELLPAMENLAGFYRLARRTKEAARMEARVRELKTRRWKRTSF